MIIEVLGSLERTDVKIAACANDVVLCWAIWFFKLKCRAINSRIGDLETRNNVTRRATQGGYLSYYSEAYDH